MAVTNDVQTTRVFGVSRRLSEAFQLMRAKLVFNLLVTAVAGALALAPTAVLLIYQIEMILFSVIAAIWAALIFVVWSGVLVLAAEDTRRENPIDLGRHVALALRCIGPLLAAGVVAFIAIGAGFIAFLVPGLWIMSVFSVIWSAVLIDGAGYSALNRSAQLTKGYRWPIVGLYFVLAILSFLINVLIEVLVAVLPVLAIPLAIIYSIVMYTYYPILQVVIHARLVAIKEGGGKDVANVFE